MRTPTRAGAGRRRSGSRGLWIAGLALLGFTDAATAQTAEALAAKCTNGGGDAAVCALGAGAGRDVAGAITMLNGAGSAISGQGSTLGVRLGGSPRFAAALRGVGMSVVTPNLADAAGQPERSSFVTGAEATIGAGIFEGLNLLPTVGGFLSVDLFASGSWLMLPADAGFDGRLTVLSVGARVGLLRESFTLPSVTVSAARRFSGDVRLGDVATVGGDLGEVTVDPSITSLRATVGKDLFAIGVLAGVGWDEFSSATTLRATDGLLGFTNDTGDIEGSRTTYFAGLSKQIGVLAWLSAEAGWVDGFAPVTGGSAASPDTGRQIYGSLALVLKL